MRDFVVVLQSSFTAVDPGEWLEQAGKVVAHVEGFDASAGQCCRRCERGRERARRVTTAARADDAQQARASERARPPSTPAPPSYRDLVAKIAQPDARQAASPHARAPPTAQVAP